MAEQRADGRLPRVVAAQAAVAGHPDQARAVADHAAHAVVAQARRQHGLAADAPGLAAGGVDRDDAVADGGQPDLAGPHFGDAADLLHRQRHARGLGLLAHRARGLAGCDDEGAFVRGAGPQPPGAVFQQRMHFELHRGPRRQRGGGGVLPRRGCRQRHRHESTALGRTAQQADVGAHPQRTAAAAQHGQHAAPAQPLDRRVGRSPLQLTVGREGQGVQAAGGGHPQPALSVVGDAMHADVAQALRPGAQRDEAAAGPVVAHQAARAGADPQAAGSVAVQGLDHVVGQGACLARLRPVHLQPVAVPAGQATQRADPQEALAVLGDGHRNLVRQAVLQRQVFEGVLRHLAPAALGRGHGRRPPRRPQQHPEQRPQDRQQPHRSTPDRQCSGTGADGWVHAAHCVRRPRHGQPPRTQQTVRNVSL